MQAENLVWLSPRGDSSWRRHYAEVLKLMVNNYIYKKHIKNTNGMEKNTSVSFPPRLAGVSRYNHPFKRGFAKNESGVRHTAKKSAYRY